MNTVYRHIWSKRLGRVIVVPECARGAGGKTGRRRRAVAALAAAAMMVLPAWAQDLPVGGQIVSGQGNISQSGALMTINQSSERMIASWQGFSIGQGNTVIFNQPGASSVALNRVTGQDPSTILGNLNANGQVFLLNPNGIAIGATGSVQTGGFVASTLGISNEDFLSGTYRFTGTGGTVTNNGDVSGNIVALIAPRVTNNGTVTGDTALAAGTDVLLDFDGNGLISVEVKASTVAGLVENNGLVAANGQAILTARGASEALKGVVNNTGTVEATGIAERGGRLLLLGDMANGEVNASGTLRADFVETSAAKVNLDRDLQVETNGGEWLIDPVNITIDSAKASAIQTALASGNVTVSTANGVGWAGQFNGTGNDEGNITVNASITWSSNVLTLNADNNITINAELTSTGTTSNDGLILQYGQTTATGDYTIGAPINLAAGSLFQTQHAGNAAMTYTIITDVTALQNISTGLSGNYVLGANIDASATGGWNGNQGFAPIGNPSSQFSGVFDGLGHSISTLTINRPGATHVGLFGYLASTASVRNVGLVDGHVTGTFYVGGLAGWNNGTIANAYNTGSVNGSYVGGLVGWNNGGTIANAYAMGNVTGVDYAGGLVGVSNGGTIARAYATGRVSGEVGIGGLMAVSFGAVITASFYDSQTTEQSDTGKGEGKTTAEMQNPFTFIEAGWDFAGAWGKGVDDNLNDGYMVLRGSTSADNELYSAYVSVTNGQNFVRSYGSTDSAIAGLTMTGVGLSGLTASWGNAVSPTANAGTVYNLANTGVLVFSHESGQPIYVGSFGDGQLTIEKAALTITANNAAKTYDGLAFAGGNGVSYTGFVNGENVSALSGNLTWAGTAQGAVNAGNYTVTASGLISGNYDIAYVDGVLTVDKAALAVSTADVTKTYDGTTAANGIAVVVSGQLFGTDSLSGGSFAFTDANAGTAKTVTVAGVAVNDGNGGNNYTIAYLDSIGSAIDRAALTITANNAFKTYDGLAFAGGNGVSYTGFVNDENVSVLSGSLIWDGTAQGAVNAGGYTLTASGLISANYDIAYVDGALTVGKAALTITANDAAKTYDGLAFAGGNGVTYVGLVNGEDVSVLSGGLNWGGTAQGAVYAGRYSLTASGLSSDNYDIAYVDGQLTVSSMGVPPLMPLQLGQAGASNPGNWLFAGSSVEQLSSGPELILEEDGQ